MLSDGRPALAGYAGWPNLPRMHQPHLQYLIILQQHAGWCMHLSRCQCHL